MKLPTLAAAFGVACLISSPAPAADSGSSMVVKPDKAAMEARSQECMKEAEVRGLQGKERKRFREKCKRGEN